MKKIITALIIVVCLAGSFKAESQISTSINFNTFYTQLSPYGSWINNPDYGQVWIANVNGFEPYSNDGHWEYSNYGWTWVSDYDWGWAPFHYGRWTYIPAYGWAWVPGYEWAPAWVSWCQYDGYYGWAPLSPGMGFNTGFGGIPYNNWRFVRYQYINNQHINHHFSRPAIQSDHYNNVTIINNTQVNNNITYATGPAQQEVERVTRKKITPKQLSFSEELIPKTKVAANEIKLYRPDANKNNADNVKPATPVKQQPVPLADNTGEVKAATVKQPVTKQPQPLQTEQIPVKQTEQQLAPQKNQPVSPVQEVDIIKQAPIRQQQDEAAQDRKQAAIKKSQDELARQQQLKDQQAVQQQKLQQQNEQRIQEARQTEQRKQQQEQMRQEKMQQQQMKRQEREQKILPVQQPSPAPKPSQPVRPVKKG